ncbi:hypothetical protein [Fimbriiglobus ruber]|uniref:Uncharacterized protein n=1 Tax=Fimbriiglobus ruber TaxID=1908690 RepID=A0A225DGS8_9BACT|nr:hypothetical protein [Fimbriiglobus ruber]OWK38884.1 hypothetical protein FRUB_06389 [Fimbriiglobus ruber]
MNSYNSLSDDFGISMYLASKVDMPTGRETVLHFFEAIQKHYPKMTDFEKRDGNEYMLEEDRDAGSYRWASLDPKRLSSGFVNPPTLEDADQQNERLLDMAPYHLGISSLDTDSLDVVYYFDLMYAGNHDEVVAEALATGGPLESLSKLQAGRVLNYQPAMMVVLDESCQLQCRLSVETRTTAYQMRTGNFPEAPISVYFTVRQFWGKQPFKTFADSYRNQRRLLDELVTDHIVPHVVQPLARAISAKQ